MPDIPRNNLNIEVRNGEAVSPKDKVAWKVGSVDTSYRTTVIDVEWNVSANGLIKPCVLYEPITIPGATLSYATGFNAKFIFDNGIGKGATHYGEALGRRHSIYHFCCISCGNDEQTRYRLTRS